MEEIKSKLLQDDLLYEDFIVILGQFKNVLKETHDAEIESKIQETINLFFKNWEKFGKMDAELKKLAIYSFEILNTVRYEWDASLFSQETLLFLEKIKYFPLYSNQDITTPDFWIHFNLKQAVLVLENIKKELDLLSVELKPVHSRLIAIKREIQGLLNRKSPHSWSLLQVNNLQDELRNIEKLKVFY